MIIGINNGFGFFCFVLLRIQMQGLTQAKQGSTMSHTLSLCLLETGSYVSQAGVNSLITKDGFELLTSCPNLLSSWVIGIHQHGFFWGGGVEGNQTQDFLCVSLIFIILYFYYPKLRKKKEINTILKAT